MKNVVKKYWPAAAGLAFTFLLAFSLHLVRANLAQVADFPTRTVTQNENSVNIEISEGELGLQIARDLHNAGVTASVTAFYQLAINDSRALQIAPGTHQLSLKISAKQALEQLLDPKRNAGLVSIIEGTWRSEIAEKLAAVGFKDIASAFKQVSVPEGFTQAEGIYFPAQYSFAKETSTKYAIQQMIDRFSVEAEKVGLKSEKDLIIASLIQAEGDPKDFPKISRVIYNRLKIGMPLQLDTTVQYVLKKRGSVFLSTKSTMIDSPYNTYKRYGLPPTPIGNPGVLAMKAALAPEPGDWLYFITVKPGDTRFTKSHDEFLIWKNEYLKNLKAGAFK
ncbi:MAG: endolytic transglycosylase MltG [Actinomycetales bacterium]|nr:endolytic transglycosylase MltG [Actinomycetales bacterium]